MKILRKKIVEEVNSAEIIGVIADTTPDISHMDQLTVSARFINSNNKPKELLIDIAEIKDKTGEGMAKGIVKSLTMRNLNKYIVRFQTYDSAASMLAYTKVRNRNDQKYLKNLSYIFPAHLMVLI